MPHKQSFTQAEFYTSFLNGAWETDELCHWCSGPECCESAEVRAERCLQVLQDMSCSTWQLSAMSANRWRSLTSSCAKLAFASCAHQLLRQAFQVHIGTSDQENMIRRDLQELAAVAESRDNDPAIEPADDGWKRQYGQRFLKASSFLSHDMSVFHVLASCICSTPLDRLFGQIFGVEDFELTSPAERLEYVLSLASQHGRLQIVLTELFSLLDDQSDMAVICQIHSESTGRPAGVASSISGLPREICGLPASPLRSKSISLPVIRYSYLMECSPTKLLPVSRCSVVLCDGDGAVGRTVQLTGSKHSSMSSMTHQ